MEIEEVMLNENIVNDNRCRICLENAQGTVNLQELANPKEEELTYWDILLQLCFIETENNINAPQNICAECAKNTETCYGFKLLCENSDKVLKEELSPDISEDDDFPEMIEVDKDLKIELFEEKIFPNLGIDNIDPIKADENKINEEIESVDEETQNVSKAIEERQNVSKIIEGTQNVDKNIEETQNVHKNIEETKNNSRINKETQNMNSIHKEMESIITVSDNSNDTNYDFDNTENDLEQTFPEDDLISLSSDDERMTTCEACSITFENESQYKQHMSITHCDENVDKNLPETMSCGYKPQSLDDYNNHMMKHTKNWRNSRRHKCPHCGESHRGHNLTNHLLKVHGDKKIGCVYCAELIFKPNCLIRHMKLKHPDDNIVCILCEFRSDVHDLYYEHMKESHKDFFPVRKCEFCDFTTISVISLGKHMTTQHEDKKTLKCSICDKAFFSEKTKLRHVKSHEDRIRFYCETCGKSYKYKRDLNNHINGHSNDKVIECNVCQKKFNRMDNYISHKRSHSDERSFKCEECGNCFKRRQGLNNHIDRVHKKIKKCECNICFKKFSSGNELKVHMKRHSGLKEVQCEFCDKSFCRNWELKQHMVVHTGERRYVCEVCGKGFTQAQVLRGHMKTHNKPCNYLKTKIE